MDITRHSPTKGELESHNSLSDEEILATNDVFNLSSRSNSQQLLNESGLPLDLDGQVHRLVAENIAVVGASSIHSQYTDSWEVADADKFRGFDGLDVVDVNKSPSARRSELRVTSEFSETKNLSELSSEGGFESQGSLTPDPNIICHEYEPDDVHGSRYDDVDEKLTGVPVIHEISDPAEISEMYKKRNTAPVIRPWKESMVDKSEIPSKVPKPSNSDISDLGDRVYYANLNATHRKSIASLPLDDNEGRLALQDQFFEALIRVYEEKKGFFPRALLSSLVTEERVFNELINCLKESHTPGQIRAYANKICEEVPLLEDEDDIRPPKIKSFKRIFVILVLIEKTASISKFLEENVNDLCLPLVKSQKGGNGSRFDLRKSQMQHQPLECFQNWTPLYVRAFEEWQWTTVSPFFHKGMRKDVQHFPLQDSIILPFTKDSRRDDQSALQAVVEGGYSRVFFVEMHRDHHNFDIPKHLKHSFAIKRLNSQNREVFKKEVEMLKMFSDNSHPNLISLLATYEQFRAYFLIFPCADGDLTKFWSVIKPKPCFDLKTVRWVAKECEGLASGLVKIHKYQTSSLNAQLGSTEKWYGRHGDLKPENILWFPDAEGGKLKISDFGLADYSKTHSKSYKPQNSIATSMSYRPPECDLKDGLIGQSYDIWTLGCLYLEFITWLLGGWALVKKFAMDRSSFDPMWCDMDTDTFFELVECPKSRILAAMVKPTVKKFIQGLHAHEMCTEFLHEFINMIRLDMMIVKSNDPAEKRRMTIEEVHVKLAGMLKKCENQDYAWKPAPWSKERYDSYNGDEAVEVHIGDLAVAKRLRQKRLRSYEGPIQERLHAKTLEVPHVGSRSHH